MKLLFKIAVYGVLGMIVLGMGLLGYVGLSQQVYCDESGYEMPYNDYTDQTLQDNRAECAQGY